jgi:CheY-like chemotaxis protein
MAVSSMEDDPTLPEKFRDELAMISRNVDLEARLIDDLLDLSRVTGGKLRLQTEPTRAHDVLRHVFQVCDGDLRAKQLSLAADLAAADDHVTADQARLQQVFWNLLKNSVKFTPPGGRITVRSRNNGDGRLVVDVQDTGVGIPADVLPKVFDAFEQGDPTVTRQFGGLGLGLAISKALVDLHGGAIRAASDGKDRGATFTIELPTAVHAAAAAAAQPVAANHHASHRRRAPRVLLVEDHADTARTLARLLKEGGYDVTTAATVSAALAAAASSAAPFDVLVSDIGLPDASGYDLMREVARLYGTPGIALTGYGMDDDVRKGHDAGFVEHIVKPVHVAQLEAALERIINDGTG